MVTEVMGFLIIAGAIILCILRYFSRKHSQPLVEQQEMRDATGQLKAELEKTGASIIARMEDRVNHLEHMIKEAERSRSVLDSRIMELRELAGYAAQQSDAMRSLHEEIAEARSLQQQLMEVSAHAVRQSQRDMALTHRLERVDAQDFSAVLHASIAREEAAMQAEREGPAVRVELHSKMPQQMQEPSPQQPAAAENAVGTAAGIEAAQVQQTEEDEPSVDTTAASPEAKVPDSMKARNLLLSGWSVEDVARETGMGRGAVELVKEMTRRQMEGKA